MRSVIPMKIAKIMNIVMAICFCVFGVLVIALPEMSELSIRLVTGIFMILFGVFKLIGYFSKDLYRLAFQYDLQLGIVLIVLGIAVLTRPEQVVNFICIIFGISIFIDSVFKIKISVDAKKFGIKPWWLILALAIIACILGIVLLFRPSDNVRVWSVLFGVSFLEDGILNLVEKLCTVKIVKNQQPDSVDKIETEEN